MDQFHAAAEGNLQWFRDNESKHLELSAKSGYNCTALELAVSNGHFEVVQYLIERLGDSAVENNFLLQEAAYNGHIDVLKYIVENGASIFDNDTIALQSAAEGGRLEVVQYLIKEGADVTVNGNAPLVYAVECGHFEVVQELCKHGADLFEIPLVSDSSLQFVAEYILDLCEIDTPTYEAISDEFRNSLIKNIQDTSSHLRKSFQLGLLASGKLEILEQLLQCPATHEREAENRSLSTRRI